MSCTGGRGVFRMWWREIKCLLDRKREKEREKEREKGSLGEPLNQSIRRMC